MAPRKTTAKKVVATPVETPEPQEVAVVEVPQKPGLVLEGDPEQQLEFAQKAAKALMSVVNQKPKKVMIQGKQYLEFGDWQTLARFFGAAVATEWTKEIVRDGKIIGYEAKCTVLRQGVVISSAEGMCTIDEKRWGNADEYAIRSMAQTRTGAKALRNAYGWVAELAGYSSTPAEEMDGVEQKPPRAAYSRPAPSYGGYGDQGSGVIDRTDEPFPSAPKKPVKDSLEDKKRTLTLQLRALGHNTTGMPKAEAGALVTKYTGLAPTTENFDEIITRLDFRIAEIKEAGPLATEFMDNGEPTIT